MVKTDFTRDYYGDLELQPSANENDIKKQFRKLALLYHPDRNPGREVEMSAKFQIIQAAHEVLTDAEQRAKYDSGRDRTPRTTTKAYSTTASGVRGNPWANAGSQWAPPPKAPPPKAPPPTSSGARRYNNFQKGAAPTATRPSYGAYEAARDNAEAWDRMRGQGRGRAEDYTSRPPPPPPPQAHPYADTRPGATPSRTPSTRRGYAPATPGGDEPQASQSSAYSTTRSARKVPDPPPRAPMPPPQTDSPRPMRDKATPVEPRISTPYTTHGGERLNPFESLDINRSKSAKDAPGRPTEPKSSTSRSQERGRSASPARSKQQPTYSAETNTQGCPDEKTDSSKPPQNPPSTAANPDQSRTNVRSPQFVDLTSSGEEDDSSSTPEDASFGTRPRAYARRRATRNASSAGDAKNEPKMYVEQFITSTPKVHGPGLLYTAILGNRRVHVARGKQASACINAIHDSSETRTEGSSPSNIAASRSFVKHDAEDALPPRPDALNAFESAQYHLLDNLVTRSSLVNNSVRSRQRGLNPDAQNSSSSSTDKQARSWAFPHPSPDAFAGMVPEPALGVSRHDLRSVTSSGLKCKSLQEPFQQRNSHIFSVNPRFGDVLTLVISLADHVGKNRFSYAAPEERNKFRNASPTSFAANGSTENISTTFSPEDWNGKFEAGYFTGDNSSGGGLQGKARGNARPKSPSKRRPSSRTTTSTGVAGFSTDSEFTQGRGDCELPQQSPGGTKFSAEEWASTFKPQSFAPPIFPGSGPSVRSARSRRTRTGSTKGNSPVRRHTRGNAVMLDSDEEVELEQSSSPNDADRSPIDGPSRSSPNAMDLDPPIPINHGESVSGVARPQESATRGSNLESGTTFQINEGQPRSPASKTPQPGLPPRPAKEPLSQQTSPAADDAGEIKTSLEDLKGVEPLQNPASGLSSFSDLNSTLPFPSKAANSVPISRNFASGQLEIPHPPKVPLMPSIAVDAARPTQTSWDSYLVSFKAYMVEWDIFNTKILAHFIARKQQVADLPSGWLEAFGDTCCDKYVEGLKEDEKVRAYWDVATDKHRKAMDDFRWMRDVMKQGKGAVPVTRELI